MPCSSFPSLHASAHGPEPPCTAPFPPSPHPFYSPLRDRAGSGGHGREEWYRRGLHTLPGSPPRPKWNASDDSFLNSLLSRWHVQPYSSQPGVYLLQQPTDFACVLLIQDACYLFMQGKSKHHQPHTGIWFARDRTRDLSQISIVNNVCHLYSDRLADALYESWLELSWHELAAALEREAVHGKGVSRERVEAGVGGRGERGGTEGRGRERQAFWKGRRKGRGAERAGGGAEGEEVGAGGVDVGAGGVGGGMSVEDVKEVARLHAAAVRKRKAVMAAAAAASAAAGETSTQQDNSKGGSRNGRNKGRSNGSNNKGSSSNGAAWAQYHASTDQSATGDNGLGYSLDALDAPESRESLEALDASDGPVVEPVRLRDPSDDWPPPGTGARAQEAKAQEAKAGERAGRGVRGGGGGGRERVEVGQTGGKVSGKGGTSVRGGGGGRESGRTVKVKVVSARRKLLGIWGSRQRHSRGRRTQQSHRRSSSSSNAANTTTSTSSSSSSSSSSASVSSRSKYHLPQMHTLQPRHTAMDNLADGFAQEADEQPPVDLSDLKRRSLHTYGRLTNHLGMTRYVGVSERRSRERLVRGMRGRGVRVGVVARYGSAVGEFGRALVPLMEVAGHLEGSLQAQTDTAQLGQQQRGEERQVEQAGRGEQGGEQQRRGDEGVVVFFPGDDSIRSPWTVHAARLLFGDATRVEAGRVAGQRNLLLPISKLHRPHSADLTRRRASQTTQATHATQNSQATHTAAATLHAPQPTHSLTDPLPSFSSAPILPKTPQQALQPSSLAPPLALKSLDVSIQAVSPQAMASASVDRTGRVVPSRRQEGASAVTDGGARVGLQGNYGNGSQSQVRPEVYERRILPKLAIHASPEERLAVGVAALPLGDKRRAAALANPLAAAAAAAAAAAGAAGGVAAGGVGVEEARRRTDMGSRPREGVGQKQHGAGVKGKSGEEGELNEHEKTKRDKERKRLEGEEAQGEDDDPVADAEAIARQEIDDYLDQYQEEQHRTDRDSDHDSDSDRLPLPTDTNFSPTPNLNLSGLATAEPGATGIEASPPSSTGGLQPVIPTQTFLYLLPDRDALGRLTGSTGKDSWQVTLVERDNVEGLKNQQEVVALIQEVFPELPVVIVRLGNVSLYDQVTIMKRTLILVAVHDLILSTSLFFLPRGAVLLELFPYKLFSTQHKKLALRSESRLVQCTVTPHRGFLRCYPVIPGATRCRTVPQTRIQRRSQRSAAMRARMREISNRALAFRGVAIAAFLLSATCASATAHDHPFFSPFRSALALKALEVEPSPSPESLRESRRALNAVEVESIAGPGCVNAFPAKPLCKFVDSLTSRVIPVLDGGSGKTLTIGVYQTYQKFHRDLPATKIYAYGVSEKTASYPGPTIVAKKGVTTRVTWCNRLQDRQHMFTQDYTLMKEMPKPKKGGIPTVPHHHGGETMSKYDGHPLAWFTQFGEHGPTFSSSSSSHSPNSSYSSSSSSSSSPCVTYEYRNQQPASLTWYHDHTLAWTRLNTVAGMAGFYIKTDANGDERDMKAWLPPWKRTVPLAIADRLFFKNGSINFPNVGVDPKVHPNWIPEYIGDTIVVNGLVWPYLRVRPAVYRFLLLGAANARFFNLRFQCAARGDYPNFVPPLRGSVVNFALIGSDGGYLQRPVFLSSLLLAPGERYDILVDFAAAQQGGACRDVILTNDAAAPYPGGEAVDGNTGVVMRFVILDRSPFKAPAIPKRIVPVPSIDFSKIHRVRWKKLVETTNPISGMPERATIDGLRYMDPVTEIPVQGSNEIWHIINLSADAHPIHLHLVQFRVVSRRAFDAMAYQANKCSFTSKNRPSCFVGPEMKAQKHEIGWKDTVPALPGQVLTFWVGWYGQVSSQLSEARWKLARERGG
ncbi:unnamed protein product [Closterium sp. Naga37s-1]|nr:unnamed protein product [Closterium sp. Naga37s-1]